VEVLGCDFRHYLRIGVWGKVVSRGLEAKAAESGIEALVFPLLGCHGRTFGQRAAPREPNREAQLESMISADGEWQKR
jgi:hypothetical protein